MTRRIVFLKVFAQVRNTSAITNVDHKKGVGSYIWAEYIQSISVNFGLLFNLLTKRIRMAKVFD